MTHGYNFTIDVRKALTASREAAGRLGHQYVGTEHMLLGLIHAEKSEASALLLRLSVDLEDLRQRVESAVRPGTNTAVAPDLPYTSRAKKTLELAMSSARERGDSYVGTEHLLLGILREERGIAAQVLTAVGVTLESVLAALPQRTPDEFRNPYQESLALDEDQPRLAGVSAVSGQIAALGPVSGPAMPILLGIGLIALIASGINAYEPGTWLLEVFPILLGVPLLIATRRRFPLTPLVYGLIFVHALILMLGGHYTYARVPLGFWMQDAFDLARNHYDRIGHFAQGFVPALIAREILLRKTPLRPGKWLFFLVTCVCLSVSVAYEFIEWFAAIMGGSSAESFLGTQGDVWDTQWDMFMALLGAVTAQLLLSRVHDRQLAWPQAHPLPRR